MLNARADAEPRSRGRDELIEIGLPIVRRVAFRLARRLPPNVEVDDLVGAGTEGLLRAIEGYDPARSPAFEPYAEARIRGAILDELRASDPLTRHGRRRLAAITKAIKSLQVELDREPSEDEVAARLGIPLEEYQRVSGELARGPALGRLGDIEPDDVPGAITDPCALYDERELKERLAQAIASLPPRTQQVLALYYQHECTQSEIGRILGVTESRVCQILGEAAARLRARLADSDARPPSGVRRVGA